MTGKTKYLDMILVYEKFSRSFKIWLSWQSNWYWVNLNHNLMLSISLKLDKSISILSYVLICNCDLFLNTNWSSVSNVIKAFNIWCRRQSQTESSNADERNQDRSCATYFVSLVTQSIVYYTLSCTIYILDLVKK